MILPIQALRLALTAAMICVSVSSSSAICPLCHKNQVAVSGCAMRNVARFRLFKYCNFLPHQRICDNVSSSSAVCQFCNKNQVTVSGCAVRNFARFRLFKYCDLLPHQRICDNVSSSYAVRLFCHKNQVAIPDSVMKKLHTKCCHLLPINELLKPAFPTRPPSSHSLK